MQEDTFLIERDTSLKLTYVGVPVEGLLVPVSPIDWPALVLTEGELVVPCDIVGTYEGLLSLGAEEGDNELGGKDVGLTVSSFKNCSVGAPYNDGRNDDDEEEDDGRRVSVGVGSVGVACVDEFNIHSSFKDPLRTVGTWKESKARLCMRGACMIKHCV